MESLTAFPVFGLNVTLKLLARRYAMKLNVWGFGLAVEL